MQLVGDMIVRDRKSALASPRTTQARANEIAQAFTPRSLERESWPLSKAELKALDVKAGRAKAKEAG